MNTNVPIISLAERANLFANKEDQYIVAREAGDPARCGPQAPTKCLSVGNRTEFVHKTEICGIFGFTIRLRPGYTRSFRRARAGSARLRYRRAPGLGSAAARGATGGRPSPPPTSQDRPPGRRSRGRRPTHPSLDRADNRRGRGRTPSRARSSGLVGCHSRRGVRASAGDRCIVGDGVSEQHARNVIPAPSCHRNPRRQLPPQSDRPMSCSSRRIRYAAIQKQSIESWMSPHRAN